MKRKTFHCVTAALLGLALTAFLLLLGTSVPARAGSNVHCVNQAGTNCAAVCGGGCYASVQAAVDGAFAGHEIRIAAGIYTAPGGTVAVVAKPLTLRGGYGQSCGDDDFDPGLHQTVLDAQWGGSVISITNAGDVTLQHLTLTHGDGQGNCPGWPGSCGGGIYASGTNLYVGQCVVTDNVGGVVGGANGGGIYAYANGHHVEIWESRIVNNTAALSTTVSSEYGNGGGIYIYQGTASLWANEVADNVGGVNHGGSGGIHLRNVAQANVLTNTIRGNKGCLSIYYGSGGGLIVESYSVGVYAAGNRIENNRAGSLAGLGGGVNVGESDVHLARNTIVGNTTGAVGGDGGGVYILSDRPVTLSNNLIARNIAPNSGGGVYATLGGAPGSQALLVNNTIVDNGFSGIVADQYAVLTVTNNIVAGHTVGITETAPASITIIADHNLFWNGFDPIVGSNVIHADPLLTADYHLGIGSPAEDAGVTVPWLTDDLAGDSRPQGGGYDIGAYEGTRSEVFLPLVMRNY